jgi:hypothetical protein
MPDDDAWQPTATWFTDPLQYVTAESLRRINPKYQGKLFGFYGEIPEPAKPSLLGAQTLLDDHARRWGTLA